MPSGRRRSLSTGAPILQPASGLLSRGLDSLRRHHRHTSEQINDTTRQEVITSIPQNPPDCRPHCPETCTASHIRLIPDLGLTSRSFVFDVIERTLHPGNIIRLGRYSEKTPASEKVSFKSKVVSRCHAELWVEDGKVFIRDAGSSSGTFLNRIRLSSPSTSAGGAHEMKDGDIIQLGVDYKGGTESMYRAVKMRLEVNREWQSRANQFSRTAFQHLQQRLIGPGASMLVQESADLSNGQPKDFGDLSDSEYSRPKTVCPDKQPSTPQEKAFEQEIQECCICMYAIAPFQALFITPCSHIYHYRCIRPILNQNPPGFSCPLCRTYSDLDANVAVEVSEVLEMLGLTPVENQKSSDEDDYNPRTLAPHDEELSAEEEESRTSSTVPAIDLVSSGSGYPNKLPPTSLFRARSTATANGDGLLSTTLVGSPPTFGDIPINSDNLPI
ncbi:hypothetical protein CLU79DRAFT_751442 [Phycomyces nitens]|nr:hypothetical protein CLU79DRAFT_751442 [Phycomyces nitens]